MYNNEVSRFYRDLHGQQLVIPNLKPLYANWASGQNPLYKKLVEVIDEHLDKFVADEKARNKFKAIDLAFFASVIYPTAEWQRLKTMALFATALFILDDSIDKEIEPTVVDYASDYAAATAFRRNCVVVMRNQLNVDNEIISRTQYPEEFASFSEVASVLTKVDPKQLHIPILAQDLEEFINASGPEQEYRLTGKFPTVDQYWSFRHGVGAVFAFATLHQYVTDTRLPVELAWSEEVMTMRVESSVQPCVCNDLFSLKKEIHEETVTNLIPIMMNGTNESLDSTVKKLTDQLYASAERFDIAATCLRERGQDYDITVQQELDRFIETFETFQTGCFQFYIQSKRFGILDYKLEDGSFAVSL